ncbi:hypothetical protein RDWZM_001731 [Blomia tropicalis]|uniref:C2H2-type domain-containing protein n=1 Tax=Blomia tropicalis TaxID=40697 RepID=A0A9Q0MC79_BLOTA|nr:hypothetical protein RDWZM_001731 [Blomia tropicalis]
MFQSHSITHDDSMNNHLPIKKRIARDHMATPFIAPSMFPFTYVPLIPTYHSRLFAHFHPHYHQYANGSNHHHHQYQPNHYSNVCSPSPSSYSTDSDESNRIVPSTFQQQSMTCGQCGKQYDSMSRFRAHQRRHESKLSGRYQCTICSKNFVQRSSLKTHERIHTGEKPYHCHLCFERFGDFSTFTKHRRTHTGEKPYGCPICGRTFSQSGNMHRHLKVVHKP